MHRNLVSAAPRVALGASLSCSVRHQSTDQYHRFLHRPHVVQPDGVDGIAETKSAQQMWLNTEQWDGYSDTYLKRFMQYPSSVELPNPQVTPKNPLLDECLRYVFELYGPCAERLLKLHQDPLHPRFHEWLQSVRDGREKIAVVLDKHYAALHPTVKTVWDAHLVRKYYVLEDWANHVEKKRCNLFERLSPEHIEFMLKAKGASDEYIQRLEKLKMVFVADPAAGILPDGCHYTEEEVMMVRQKAQYYRHMHKFGANKHAANMMPH
jgi:hypothetical protein